MYRNTIITTPPALETIKESTISMLTGSLPAVASNYVGVGRLPHPYELQRGKYTLGCFWVGSLHVRNVRYLGSGGVDARRQPWERKTCRWLRCHALPTCCFFITLL